MLRKAKYFRDCSELKAATFFRILKTGDKTLLCYDGKPNPKECSRIWESIELEFERETATPEYKHQLSETNFEYLTSIRINGLILLYNQKKLAPERNWTEDEVFWDVQGYDADAIHSLILQEITRYKIYKLQEKERQELKGNEEKMTIEDLKLAVEEWLNKDYIDFEKITVLEWIGMIRRVKKKSEQLKKDVRADNPQ
jgi:hypothetical protein